MSLDGTERVRVGATLSAPLATEYVMVDGDLVALTRPYLAGEHTTPGDPAVPTVRQVASYTTDGVANTQRTVTPLAFPEPAQAGSVLVGMVTVDKGFSSYTPAAYVPSGWSLVGGQNFTGEVAVVAVWRVAAGGETSVPWATEITNSAGTSWGSCAVEVVTDADTFTGSAGTNATGTSITTGGSLVNPAPGFALAFVGTDTADSLTAYNVSWSTGWATAVKTQDTPGAQGVPPGGAIAFRPDAGGAVPVTATLKNDGHALLVGAWHTN